VSAFHATRGNIELERQMLTEKPVTHASLGALKQVDAGVLNVGYAEAGPAVRWRSRIQSIHPNSELSIMARNRGSSRRSCGSSTSTTRIFLFRRFSAGPVTAEKTRSVMKTSASPCSRM
jgi:hypothetical protein